MSRHTKENHTDSTYNCEYCGHETKRRDNLVRHIKFKHEGFRVKCDICEYTCADQRILKLHERNEHTDIIQELTPGDKISARPESLNNIDNIILNIISPIKEEQNKADNISSEEDESTVNVDAVTQNMKSISSGMKNHKGVVIFEEEETNFVTIKRLSRPTIQQSYDNRDKKHKKRQA